MPFDGSVWSNTTPTNSDLANEIDDYMRDIKIGVQGRMAKEHVWPSAQTGTGEAGYHTYVSFQPQSAAPTIAGTSGGALYVSTSSHLIFEESGGTLRTIVTSAKGVNVIGAYYSATGTQGDLLIGTTGGTLKVLAASADGGVLLTHTNTGDPTWAAQSSLTIPKYIQVPASTNQFAQYGSGVAISTGGSATVNFATNFADANYGLSFSMGPASFGNEGLKVTAKAAGSFTVTSPGNGGTFSWIAIGSQG